MQRILVNGSDRLRRRSFDKAAESRGKVARCVETVTGDCAYSSVVTFAERAASTVVPPKRVSELDGLRAFAILPVIFHHCYPFDGWFGWLASIGRAGAMGVDLFFVLSGYLITGILLNSAGRLHYYKNFIIRRTLRIFPLYCVCLALFTAAAWLSGGPQWTEMRKWGIGWFIVYLGNIRVAWLNTFPPISSFSPLWSLQVEEQFYLLYPLVVLLLSMRNLRRVLLACVVIAPLCRLFVPVFTGSTQCMACYVLMPCRMDALALGGLVAILVRSSSDLLPSRAQVQGGVVMMAAAVLGVFAWRPEPASVASRVFIPVLGYSIIAIACAFLLAMVVLWPPATLAALLRWRPLVYTGKIAYGLYLLHVPMSRIARKLIMHFSGMNIESHSAIAVPITFFVSFLAASISWHFFESPILALKERFTSPD